jgi:hypothetical protein
MTGSASSVDETFEFTISAFDATRFRLDISYRSTARSGTNGAGLWPTVDKAKEVAETIAQKQLGASVNWH